MLCLATAALAVGLVVDGFTLAWTHSVERTEWQERWQVVASQGLLLVEARVRGSGAGMEPADDAVWRDGWFVYRPMRQVAQLHLAISGATPSGWRLCTDAGCLVLDDWFSVPGRPPRAISASVREVCRPRAG